MNSINVLIFLINFYPLTSIPLIITLSLGLTIGMRKIKKTLKYLM